MKPISSILVLAALCTLHCGTTQPVRVAAAGEWDANVSLGGPLVLPVSNVNVPLPYLNAGIAYGLNEDFTLTGDFHVTSTLYKTFGIDGGAAMRLIAQNKSIPEVTAKAQGYLFTSLRDGRARFYPMVTINASYVIGERMLAYFGADNLFQFDSNPYFLSPFLGLEFPAGEKWKLQVESKWVAANQSTAHGIFQGAGSIGDHGCVGIYLGAQYLLRKGQ